MVPPNFLTTHLSARPQLHTPLHSAAPIQGNKGQLRVRGAQMAAGAIRYLAQPGEPADPARLDHLQHLLLNSGRMLILGGMLLAMPTVGNSTHNTAQALLGFLMLLLGASLVMLSPVGRQFPRAARVGVAVANAVFDDFSVRQI